MSTNLERHKAGYVAVRLIHQILGTTINMNLWCENAHEYKTLCEAVKVVPFKGFDGKYFTLTPMLKVLSVEKKVVE